MVLRISLIYLRKLGTQLDFPPFGLVTVFAFFVLVSISSIVFVGWKELSSSEALLRCSLTKTFRNYGIVPLTAIELFATTNNVLMMVE